MKLSNGWEGREYISMCSDLYTDKTIYAGEICLAEHKVDRRRGSRWIIHADNPQAITRIEAAILEYEEKRAEVHRKRMAEYDAECSRIERKRKEDANRAALGGGEE